MSKQGENKSNILSMDFLAEQHKQEFQMAEAFVDLNGEMLSYKYYEKLPESKVNEYIQELMEFNHKLVNDEEYRGLRNAVGLYALVALIDKFTDIDVPEDDKKKLMFATYLIDFGLLEKVISTLPEDEIKEMMKKGTEVSERQTERLKNLIKKYENQAGDIEEMSSLQLVEKDLAEENSGE